MDYAAAVAALGALEGLGMRLGLERVEALLGLLGDPHRGLRGALVAGTNGKGSVCALVESMARAAGASTVLLTKPHLLSWCERIAVDGVPVSPQRFADLVGEALSASRRLPGALGPATVFEVVTVAGILAARDRAPEFVVCEVGLGGRLDSTNVLDLGVAVVTSVAFDHRQQLGDDLAGIAREKAAIIKPGNAVVTGASGAALDAVRAAAERAPARSLTVVGGDAVWRGEDLGRAGVAVVLAPAGGGGASPDGAAPQPLRVEAPLIGAFQERNLAVAAFTARVLGLDDQAVVRGAAVVEWPGRMQWIEGSPALLVDGGHNTEAVAAMVAAAAPLAAGRRTVAVFGVMADKDVDDMLAALRPLAAEAVVFTAPATGRAAEPGGLAARWGDGARTAPGVAAALEDARALAGPHGLVVACGSLYVAGEALAAVGARPRGGLAIS